MCGYVCHNCGRCTTGESERIKPFGTCMACGELNDTSSSTCVYCGAKLLAPPGSKNVDTEH